MEMDMKFAYVFSLSAIATLGTLTACGDSDSSPSTPKDESEAAIPMDSIKTSEDLPNCTEKRQETVAYIKDDSSIRICLDEKWETTESVAATKEDLPNCSKKREALTAYVMVEHSYYTCSDERWQKNLTEPESSLSNKANSSSSNKEEKNSSSSEKAISDKDEKSSGNVDSSEESSSSTKPEESSSSKEVKPSKASLTTIIYDTDAKLHPLFSCYGSECQNGAQDIDRQTAQKAINACIGIIQGTVEITLGADKKPVLTEDGNRCFIDKKYFNQLFNYTKNVNEVVAWEMPYIQNKDGLWGYNSDTALTNNDIGGFFPVEGTTDDDILTFDGEKLGPTEDVRTTHTCDGPFKIRDTVDFYRYCNTYGWTEGNDCVKLFAGGGSNLSFWNPISRWEGLPRNHHFCMEIHGTFTYSENQEAAFSANGDQWVFIGNKLAVDNGGIHLNAPGFVQLKQLNKTYDSFMKEGKEYPIDIFYCARQTTMSGFSIQTNFAITQN